MKICFYPPSYSTGGPTVFTKNIVSFLIGKGIEVSFDPQTLCDILFVVIQAPPDVIMRKRREGAKIIQRLDGVYFYKDRDYERMNAGMRYLHQMADFVVYQSQFSKDMCQRYLGMPMGNWRIIYNPVDINRFTPYGKKIALTRKHILLAVSLWRPHKRLKDIISAFKELLKYRDDIFFLVIGGGVQIEGNGSEYYRFIGSIPHEELPIYYRSADVFLHPSWLDWCPNVVLEAMASGTPVIYADTGGTQELVKEGGIRLITGYVFDYRPKDLYNDEEIPRIDPKQFALAINTIIENRRGYSWLARKRAREKFSLEVIGKQYIDIFEEIIRDSKRVKLIPIQSTEDYLKRVVKIDTIIPIEGNRRIYQDKKTYYWHQRVGGDLRGRSPEGAPWIVDSLNYYRSFIPDTNEAKILSVGSRDGFEIGIMKGMGYKNIIGIDICEEMLILAKQRGCNVVLGDIHLIPFQDNIFDSIYCRHTLEHSYNPKKVVSEFNRILKPNGSLFLIVPIEDKIGAKHSYLFNNMDSLKELIDKSTTIIKECFIKEGHGLAPEIWMVAKKKGCYG